MCQRDAALDDPSLPLAGLALGSAFPFPPFSSVLAFVPRFEISPETLFREINKRLDRGCRTGYGYDSNNGLFVFFSLVTSQLMIVDVKQIRDPFSRVVVVVRMMRRSAESGSRLLAAVTTPVAQSPCSSTTTTTTTTAAMIKIGSNYGFVALLVSLLTLALITSTSAFTVPPVSRSVSASTCLRAALQTDNDNNNDNDKTVVVESSSSTTNAVPSRRAFLGTGLALAATAMVATLNPQPAEAVGPVKVTLLEPKYFAQPCPPSRPIPGEKAMKGMRGLCVTVDAKLDGGTPKASIAIFLWTAIETVKR